MQFEETRPLMIVRIVIVNIHFKNIYIKVSLLTYTFSQLATGNP